MLIERCGRDGHDATAGADAAAARLRAERVEARALLAQAGAPARGAAPRLGRPSRRRLRPGQAVAARAGGGVLPTRSSTRAPPSCCSARRATRRRRRASPRRRRRRAWSAVIVPRCCRRCWPSSTCWSAATPASPIWPPRSARRVVTLFGPTDPRLIGAARPRRRRRDPSGAVRPVLLPRLSDRASVPAGSRERHGRRTRPGAAPAGGRVTQRPAAARPASGREPMVDGERRSDHPAGERPARAGPPRAARRHPGRPLRGQGARGGAAARRGAAPARPVRAARSWPATRVGCARSWRPRRIDIVHAHHSHDHWLSLLDPAPARRRAAPAVLVRTFHNVRSVKRSAAGRAAATGARRRCSRCRARSRRAAARWGCRPSACVGSPARPTCRASAPPATAARSARSSGSGGRRSWSRSRASPPTAATSSSWPASASCCGHMPEARLLLVGKGERARPARAARRRAGARRTASIFTGYRDRDLPQVLAAADCFALMAAGLRRVVPRGAGGDGGGPAGRGARAWAPCRRPSSTARPGLLVGDDSPEAVAARWRTILADPARARAMGEAGRRRAETEFSPERSVAIVEARLPRRRRAVRSPAARVVPRLVVRRLLGGARHARAGAARPRGDARLPRAGPSRRVVERARARGREPRRDVRVRRRPAARARTSPTCDSCAAPMAASRRRPRAPRQGALARRRRRPAGRRPARSCARGTSPRRCGPHAGNRWLYGRATALVVTVTEAIRGQCLAAGLLPPAAHRHARGRRRRRGVPAAPGRSRPPARARRRGRPAPGRAWWPDCA